MATPIRSSDDEHFPWWAERIERVLNRVFQPIGEEGKYVDFWFQLGTWRGALIFALMGAAAMAIGVTVWDLIIR